MQYISVDLQVIDLNATSNMLVTGLPPLTAVDGFVHAIERATGIEMAGWAMGVSEFQATESHLKAVNYEHGHKGKHASNPYIRDRRSARMNAFLILVVSDETATDDHLNELEESIESFRFCGGNLELGGHGVALWPSAQMAIEQSASVSEDPVFFLEDASHLLDECPEHLSKTQWLMDLTARPNKTEDGSLEYAHGREFLGHLVPTVNGYQLLELPKHRPNLRDDVQHAYAESTLGVARMRSVGSVLANWNETCDDGVNIFWFGHYEPDTMTWRVSHF